MKTRVLAALAALGCIALAAPAVAADVSPRVVTAPQAVAVPYYNWAGFYVGGQVGYAWGHNDYRVTGFGTTFLTNSMSGNGMTGGIHAGYLWQGYGPWVFGLEASGNWAGPRGSDNVLAGSYQTTSTYTIDALAGYAFDRFLVYGLLGAAYMNSSVTVTGIEGWDTTRYGLELGGGLQYALGHNWRLGTEFRYRFMGSDTHAMRVFPGLNVATNQDHGVGLVRASYRF
jgi:outer membrane immunogenic protein